MSSTQEWLEGHYNELVKEYGGQWVLIKDRSIVFADRNFKLVHSRMKNLNLKPNECKIEYIDSGDAVFYDITLSYSEG